MGVIFKVNQNIMDRLMKLAGSVNNDRKNRWLDFGGYLEKSLHS